MQKSARLRDGLILVLVFLFTRVLLHQLGVDLQIFPLYLYWQYLDVETLKNGLLNGLLYDHAQPPVFNLFLGVVLKIFGPSATVFGVIFKLFTLINAWLIMEILRRVSRLRYLPLIAGLAYLVSPATMLFETELFYTTFISVFLLSSVYFLVRFHYRGSWAAACGLFIALTLLCLTRSVYHVLWLVMILLALLVYFRERKKFIRIAVTGTLGFLLVCGWYMKNKIIFGKFSASTWIGMNMARNVYHDNAITDSTLIEAYEPFSRIEVYRPFIDPAYEKKFIGLNDRDLLRASKNDTILNATNVNYIPVSDQYQKASVAFVKSHPAAYLQNVVQSMILYFTPATMYSLVLEKSDKIAWFDIGYSFNLTHFATDKQSRRYTLTLSALPKMLIYAIVFVILGRYWIRNRKLNSWNLFLVLTIGFVFGISSFFEHYENMRFRFETEPLFLLLAAQAVEVLWERRQRRSMAGLEGLAAKTVAE